MNSPTAQAVAAKVSADMQAKGVSVKWLAEATGIPRMTLTRRLTGNSPFDVAELDAICAQFGTTTAQLLAEAESAGAA